MAGTYRPLQGFLKKHGLEGEGAGTLTSHKCLLSTVQGREPTYPVRGLALGQAEEVWKAVAHPDLLNRHRDLAWLVAHGVLPVRAVMHARRLAQTAECPRAGCGGEETVFHALWDCGVAQELWRAAQPADGTVLGPGSRAGLRHDALRRWPGVPGGLQVESSVAGHVLLCGGPLDSKDIARPGAQRTVPAGNLEAGLQSHKDLYGAGRSALGQRGGAGQMGVCSLDSDGHGQGDPDRWIASAFVLEQRDWVQALEKDTACPVQWFSSPSAPAPDSAHDQAGTPIQGPCYQLFPEAAATTSADWPPVSRGPPPVPAPAPNQGPEPAAAPVPDPATAPGPAPGPAPAPVQESRLGPPRSPTFGRGRARAPPPAFVPDPPQVGATTPLEWGDSEVPEEGGAVGWETKPTRKRPLSRDQQEDRGYKVAPSTPPVYNRFEVLAGSQEGVEFCTSMDLKLASPPSVMSEADSWAVDNVEWSEGMDPIPLGVGDLGGAGAP
ncbi:hypothetical protein AAFF_G00418990 [Aldrovandia affinis]|uniref:Reverse transcriptase zinc-binding domain-containing protein n=1 Tax=Aldrovandia affinis TaxID=143900 RepID=A0AAD7S9W7_9TELE|nr:hypothetical protein AAFF_G00418990 [Aldrovandia affinis]